MSVLIVGAGPTGLFMAIGLALRGISCRVIEKEKAASPYSRALAIQSRTLEILDQMGMIDSFLAKGCQIKEMIPMAGGKPLARLDFTILEETYPFILSLEENSTESILEEKLRSLGVVVEREVEFLTFEQDQSQVIAKVRSTKTNQEETLVSSFLVGADGAHSSVRKQLGLAFTGEKLPQIFALADIELTWDFPHNQARVFFNSGGPVALFPLPGHHRYRVIFLTQEEMDAYLIEKRLREISGTSLSVGSVLWQSHFQVHSRMVSSYSQGRVFLAGDAAHIHSPVGGQGMNTGLQDAYNLAWKIALVLQGKKELSFLDTYDQERRKIGKTVLKATKRATRLATCQIPWIRNLCVRSLFAFSHFRKRVLYAISELSLSYCSSWRFGKRSLQVGDRAPNVPLVYRGQEMTLFALFRDHGDYRQVVVGEKRGEDEYTILPQRGYLDGYSYLIRPDGYIEKIKKL